MIAEYVQTCSACPTQLEGKLTDGRFFYYRYRWGLASLNIACSWVGARLVFPHSEIQIGGPFDGVQSLEEALDTAELLIREALLFEAARIS